MFVLATLLGALLTAAPPAPSEPTFTRADLGPDGLCFDSPVDLDWEAMARRELTGFPFDDPPRDQLLSRSSEMGVSTVTFSVDLPESLRRRHFYLVAETGPRPILPQRLHGFVQYRFHPPAKPVLEAFYGRICLPMPDGVQDAGFVATSSVPLSWRQSPANLVHSGATTLVGLESGSSALPGPGLDAGGGPPIPTPGTPPPAS